MTRRILTITTLLLLVSQAVWARIEDNGGDRFQDWKSAGCQMSPARPGMPPSEAANPGGNQAVCVPCESASGMARWWVEDPYTNLRVIDEPLSYTTSSGEQMVFRWSYRQRFRPLRPDECPGYWDLPGRVWREAGDRYLTDARKYGFTNACWMHNWMMDVLFWDRTYEKEKAAQHPPPTIFSEGWEALVFRTDGGIDYFGSGAYSPGIVKHAVRQYGLGPRSPYPTIPTSQQADTNGIYWGAAGAGFVLTHPDGSQDVFALADYLNRPSLGTLSPNSTARAFLTERVDPHGRVTRLGYESALHTNYFTCQTRCSAEYSGYRLRYVVDPDGRTNTFSYHTNVLETPIVYDHLARHLWQVTEIRDPYGRSARVDWNNAGFLIAITDAASNSSSFVYMDTSGWLKSLTTPYRTTSFEYYENPDTNGGKVDCFFQRAIHVVEPDRTNQLYLYDHFTARLATNALAPVVSGQSFDTESLRFRNTFHWGPLQYPELSSDVLTSLNLYADGTNNLPDALTHLSTNDFRKARLRHWLLGADGQSLTESLSSEREPSPDWDGSIDGPRTWFDYPTKASSWQESTAAKVYVNCIARRLPNGSNQYTRFAYSAESMWTQLHTYSLPGTGSAGIWTNQYQYASDGVDLNSVVTPVGQWSFSGYTNHQPHQILDPASRQATLNYSPSTRNLTSVTGAAGGLVLEYYPPVMTNLPLTSTSGLLQRLTLLPSGRVIEVVEYTSGLPRAVCAGGTGLPDLWQTNSWDALNRLTGVSFADGASISNVYDKLNLVATKDRAGHWTSFTYDPLEHLTSITDPRGNVTGFVWCDCGLLEGVTDALNQATTFSYNNQGLLLGLMRPDGTCLSCERDALGRVTRLYDGSTRSLYYGYNNQGLVCTVSNAYGQVQRVLYDGMNQPIEIADATGLTVTNSFDLAGRLVSRAWPGGVSEGFLWNDRGLLAYTNQDQQVTRFTIDDAGRPLGATNANGEVTWVTYNALDQVTDLWDGRTNHTAWGFNEYGWLLSKTDANNNEVLRCTYDADGQMTNRWTLEHGDSVMAYDAAGNLASVQHAGSTVLYRYDALNRLTNMVDAFGSSTFSYTSAGHLASEYSPWADGQVTYSYQHGHRSAMGIGWTWYQSYSYDQAWRLTNTWAGSQAPYAAFSYRYGSGSSPSSLVRSLTLPNGGWITNHYDALNRLDYTAVLNRWGHVLDSCAYAHDPAGLRTNISRGFGLDTNSVSVGYDAIGQITSWKAREGNGNARLNEQLGFNFDGAGNLRFRTNGALVETFTIDSLNQISGITRTGTLTVAGGTPAPASSVTVNGLAAERYTDFTFAATNLALSDGLNSFAVVASNSHGSTTNNLSINLPRSFTLQWDSNGNLTNDGTRRFSYDAENRLLTNWVDGAWMTTFVYDGLGRRRIARDYGRQGAQWVLTNETRYVYDGWLLVQERDSNNVVKVTYTRGLDLSGSLSGAGGIGGLLARTDTNGSVYYHADGAGNVTALMDPSGNVTGRYRYGPFGRLVGKWGGMADANRIQLSSMPVHGLLGIVGYFGRAYDPNLQRWLQRDPIGEAGGINLYQFNFNNPLSFIDPDGLAPQLVSVTGVMGAGVTSVGYADYHFGQDYGIGIHGPLTSPAPAMMVGSMVPGVGEAMDLSVLADPDARWWEKTLSAGSLGLNALTDGLLPNAGGFLKAGKTVCRNAAKSPPRWTAQDFVQEVATRAERRIGGTGAVAGTEKHAYAAELIERYQRRFGPVGGGLATEQSYLGGAHLGRSMNLPGSVRLDVVEGAVTSPSAVFDFKFTINPNPVLSPGRVNSIRANAGLGPNVPITVVHP